jgi:hypothetical protein
MSTASYPQGMKSYNNYINQGGYKSWKGTGLFRNPTGVTAGNIRPQTNKDVRNVAIYSHGLPRPIKHYRRGKGIPILSNETDNSPAKKYELSEANYYSDRVVRNAVSDKMIGQLLDRPGSFIVKDNGNMNGNNIVDPYRENVGPESAITDGCNDVVNACDGAQIVSSWMPISNLTENPQQNTQSPLLCCNAERKAINRVLPKSSRLTDNYYSTTSQKLFNRCQTYDQRSFNFITSVANNQMRTNFIQNDSSAIILQEMTGNSKPTAYKNLYVANCNPNININNNVEISIIDRIATILFTNSFITKEENDFYVASNIISIQDFLQFLETSIANNNKERALETAYKMMINAKINVSRFTRNPVTNSANNGCKLVVYKPSNAQFAHQGAVKSSAQISKLNTSTISANALLTEEKYGLTTLSKGLINPGGQPGTAFLYGLKSIPPPCNLNPKTFLTPCN